MITIIDYGIGNLRSIEKAFQSVAADVVRSDRIQDIERAERIVLPGVGAFGACAAEIRRRNLVAPILEAIEGGKPFLGVCVGMQLLFEVGEELGEHEGLGILPGRVRRLDHIWADAPPAGDDSEGTRPSREPAKDFPAAGLRQSEAAGPEVRSGLKIPHMGWNTIAPRATSPLLEDLQSEAYFYFVHSFAAVPERAGDILATSHYGVDFPAIVRRNNVLGVQFHPEKSQRNGLRVLKNFARLGHAAHTY